MPLIERESTVAQKGPTAIGQHTLHGFEGQHDQDTILFPMKKIKGRWKQISWEEAFDLIKRNRSKAKQAK